MRYWLREIERYWVLPFRFFRAHWRDCRQQKQKCKVCGQADGFNFYVPDEVWTAVVPPRWRERVVCLRCFDRFASRVGVDYVRHLSEVCFAGEGSSVGFEVVKGRVETSAS